MELRFGGVWLMGCRELVVLGDMRRRFSLLAAHGSGMQRR